MYEALRERTFRNMHPFDCRDGPPLACPWRWHDFRRKFEIETELRRAEGQLAADGFAVLREVMLTMDRVRPEECTAELFARLGQAAQHRLQWPSTAAIEALLALSQTQPGAADQLIELANHRSAKTRLRVVQWLNRQMPTPRAVELLGPRLEDRSAQVRSTTAQQCMLLELSEMLPQLRIRRKNESHAEALRGLDHAIALLADGFYLKRSISGDWSVTIRYGRGTFSSARCRWASKPKRAEVEQVVNEARMERQQERERVAARQIKQSPLINSQTGNVV